VKRIPLDELFRRAVDVLERERIPYFVYGGMALPAWGEVVTTEDIDFVVQMREESAARRRPGNSRFPGLWSRRFRNRACRAPQ
jgi:hypothetical protein